MGDRNYPETITPDMLGKWSHISDAEIECDIAETELEIRNYEQLREAETTIARTHPNAMERRMADFRATGRPGQIAERLALVGFLLRLQAARAESGDPAHVR